jgi:hypothetical protein
VRAFAKCPILQDKGKVGALEAKLEAEQQFEVYRQGQDEECVSDFDREIKRIEGKKPRSPKLT